MGVLLLNWKLLHSSLKVGEVAIPHYVVPFSRAIKGILKGKPEEVTEDVLYYKKGLKVLLLERLQDRPIEEINPISDPTFWWIKATGKCFGKTHKCPIGGGVKLGHLGRPAGGFSRG